MKLIWIIGMGKFGSMAVDRLGNIFPNCHFVLVDSEKKRIINAEGPNRSLEQSEGVSFLLGNLFPENSPDWIIPALPVHLLAQWIIRKKSDADFKQIRIPKEVIRLLPNCFEGKNDDIYFSHADFTCPDNCPEPRDICYATGEKRKGNMYDLVNEIGVPEFYPIVVRSHQLAPGVGGYKPDQLFQALRQVTKITRPVLLCTACRCHGVMTGVR